MFTKLSKIAVTTATAASIFFSTLPKPAAAMSVGSINTILTAAAVVGGVILYNNYVHRREAADAAVGYTANGGTVYGDGRIVMPDGRTFYPNAEGRYPWGQYAYYSQQANPNGYTYDYNRSGQWDRTRRHEHSEQAQYGGQGRYGDQGRYNDAQSRNDQRSRGDQTDRGDRGNQHEWQNHGER